MKKDKEFEREDLAVDRDIQLDSDKTINSKSWPISKPSSM